MSTLTPRRLGAGDRLRVGAAGLRTRPMRVFLSSLGIAIGIAAMVAVVGISSSSRADLDAQLDALGTNLLSAQNGTTMMGEQAVLPLSAEAMVGRIAPVTDVSAIGVVPDAKVYRSDKIPAAETKGIAAYAARTDLLETTSTELARGTWLNDSTAQYPAVVLGSAAAERLGVSSPSPEAQILVGERWFTVVGILEPSPLVPEIDSGALIGWPVAQEVLDFDGHPTTLYARAAPDQVESVQAVLGATANPEAPGEVDVAQPSDALEAQQAADQAFTALLLGIGAVALIVGGVGVANTMVISVLERRAEIGLRRSLGATRGQIRSQFLTESLLLSLLGGLAGAAIGGAVTLAYALMQGWAPVVPPWALGGGLGATLVVGCIAGLYPAARAARLSPTEALATP
ncbi:ABC transporter permease [Nocardioides sp. NPDC101246]|uniref:ABC transporter permease n=1 Tax=Nocardioides sp. NPDC101246 TaxID=3364336 RepID=UPI0037F630CC